jgi:hypothetical protein
MGFAIPDRHHTQVKYEQQGKRSFTAWVRTDEDCDGEYDVSLQDEVARAFVAHLEQRVATQNEPVVSYGNKEMKWLIRD